jgi:hypothetical protein
MSHARHERFVMLIGPGANGKSVLLAILEGLLGAENVAGVQPSNFDRSFQRAHLHMKLANIVTELRQGEVIADGASTQHGQLAIGKNAMLCLTVIPSLGVIPLAAILLAARVGAPTRPALTGLLAGLAAGGIAATFYAANCTDDSPLFVLTWYPLAIGALGFAGMAIGPLVLNW